MSNPHRLLTEEAQINAAESIRRVDRNGYLYYMESAWDYYKLPEVFLPVLDTGCATFFARNMEEEAVMYRNYDYRHYIGGERSGEPTACNIVVRSANPNVRYRSIGVADAFWLDRVTQKIGRGFPDDGESDISVLTLAPYLTVDGMNEAGLTVSIMALVVDSFWTETDYEQACETLKSSDKHNVVFENSGERPTAKEKKVEIGSLAVNHADRLAWVCGKERVAQKVEGRPETAHPILMRMMLDYCGSVDEAIGLAGKYNVKSAVPGSDFHVLVGDATGRSVVLEWIGNDLSVIETNRCTNYRLTYEDGFRGTDRRYECLCAGLDRFYDKVREDYGTTLLQLVKQDPSNTYDGSMTLFSCLYNTGKKTLRVYSMGDFGEPYDFAL